MTTEMMKAGPIAWLAGVALLFLPSCSGPESPGSGGPADGATLEPGLAQQEKEVEANPTAAGYLTLSVAFYGHGLYDKSIVASQKAIQLDPGSPIAARGYNNICASYNQLGLWESAIDACEKALAIQPDLQLARNNLGWALSSRQ